LSLPPILAPSLNGGDSLIRGSTSDRTQTVRVSEGCASDVAYILFTSGSTGRPKGVPVTHSSVCSFLDTALDRYDFGPDDVFTQNFDLTFDLAFFDLFVAWSSGGTLVHTPPGALRRLPKFLSEQGISVWFSVPRAISFVGRMGGLEAEAMPLIRWSLFCGEPLTVSDAGRWQAAANLARLENLYGPTELTIACSAYRWEPEALDESIHGIVPIGSIHPGHSYLLLGEDGTRNFSEGELCVAGPQMFSGYLRPEDDAGRFVVLDGMRWYRTGDRVRLSSGGDLLYLGRLDHQVKIQGYRVELTEVEYHMGRVPGIEASVVVPRGEGIDRELVAYYVGPTVSVDRLARELRKEVPIFMIPREFISLNRLPFNSRGKVDRGSLSQSVQRDSDSR
jgi:non-ribosomal peptide synthetase component F